MKRFLVYLKKRPLGAVSLALIAVLYLMMCFAEFIAPYGANTSFPEHTYHPPNVRFFRGKLSAQEYRAVNIISWRYVRIRDQYEEIKLFAKGEPYKLWGLIPMERHLFTTTAEGGAGGAYPVFLMGADNLGRDLFSRIIHGSRISLTIGFVATAISLLLAMLFGGLAGYFGGMTDWSIMRFAEFFMLIPGLYLILFLRSLLSVSMDSGQAYMMITLILSLVGWPGSARTIRGLVHAIKREEFIQNSKLEMIPSPVIIFSHIIPQIASILIVSIALSIPGFIMTETTLSYLGLGIVDPAVSWGSLIRRDISTISNLQAYPWLLSPVWFLLGITLAFNFFGDALRDYFDPYHTVFYKFSLKNSLKKFLTLRHKGTKVYNTESRELDIKNSLTAAQRSQREEREENEELGIGNEELKNNIQNAVPDSPPSSSSSSAPPCLCESKSSENASAPLCLRESKIPQNASVPLCLCVSKIPENAAPLCEVSDLRVTFSVLRGQERIKVQAVRGVSLEIGRGEILGIVGESGSGKSVSVQALPGLLPKNAEVTGSVLYRGSEILGLPVKALREYRGKKIGMIFQEPGRSYDPLQNMEKVFLETFRNSDPKITEEEAAEKALALLAETGLPDGERLSNFPHQFSGGQLQRISIALALAQGCELLIADEPTTALDVTIQKQIVELLKTLRKNRGLSIIFISHDIDLVSGISDRVMVMYGGLVMETTSAKTISGGGSLHPYTKALLAASPGFGSHYTAERLQVIPGKVPDPANPGTGCPFAPRCTVMAASGLSMQCTTAIPPLGRTGDHEVRCIAAAQSAVKTEAGEGE